jgi:hypothetical protein
MVTDTLGSSRSDPVVSLNMKFKLNSFVAFLIVAILVGILNGLSLEVFYEVSPANQSEFPPIYCIGFT